MGCVQSLFNPSKSRSPSPEKEFVPPTFETVVVTRQPQKSSKAADQQQQQEQSSRRAARGNDNDDDNDDDDDDDEDIVSKCDDFEKYALDENADGGSVHYVEATAVRTLAANTGSVAILGTTAKCKSAGSSPAVHVPLADNRQQTWSPSASASTPPLQRQNSTSCKSQPQLETRYVEATAVRTLAAETGSIAILGTTADPRPKQTAPGSGGERKRPDDDAGSIHYVEATAVRQLAAETGSIAILASTAAVAANGPPQPRPSSTQSVEQLYDQAAGRDVDPERMPVGVREVLDSEPVAAVVATDQPEPDQRAASEVLPDDDPQIPLPVIYAMEMKPEVEEIFKTMQTSSSVSYPSETRAVEVSTPRSTTVDGGAPVHGPATVVSSESSTRKPLLRQSNKTSEHRENDDDADGWITGNVPVVFAKCPPAKSKSLPSGNPALTREPAKTGEENNDRQHGIVRGSSLPHDTNTSKAAPFVSSTKRTDEETVVDPTLDRPVSGKQSVTEPAVVDSAVKEPAEVETTVKKPAMVETVVTETTAVEPATVIEPTAVKPVEVETKVEKPVAVKPTEEKPAKIKPAVNEPDAIKPAVSEPTVTEPVITKPAVVETNVTGTIAVAEPAVVKPVVNEPDTIKPVVVEPTVTKPAVGETKVTGTIADAEPAVTKPVVTEPDAIKPAVVKPAVNEPDAIKPAVAEPTVTKPAVVETKVTGTIADAEPAVTKPVVTEPVAVVDAPAVAAKPTTTVQSKIENEDAKAADEGESIAVDGIVSDEKTVGETTDRPLPTATDVVKPEDEKKVVQQADSGGPMVNGFGRKSEDREETSGPMVNGEPGPDDADDEYRLTMIQSVREAVNRICEQAVERTEAIVKSGRGRYRPSGNTRKKRDADDSEAADYASSEFSLPPPPPASDPASMAQESSWPPPPPLSEAEEERTIAPGFSFDLPDPPTEMDQLDSEVDKLDISDEEMRATGLPSDDDEKTDTEIIGR